MCDVLVAKPLTVATFNCRGVFTKPKGARHPRVVDLLTSFTKTRIDVLGLQEPHLRVSPGGRDEERLQGWCGRFGLHSLVNATPSGFGGTGLVWSNDWELCWAASLEPRIMFAALVSRDGLRLNILSAHFHDKASERRRQWEAVDRFVQLKVLPWVVVGAGGLGAGKTSGAGTRGVSLDVVIGVGTGYTNTNGGESSDNRGKVHADCGPAENPSL